jgi:phosphatidate cytidylyltransferase
MAMLVALRGLHTGNWGLAALITMIAVTKSADAGAYFTGKAIGKHKLIPRLSPGKTWEGAIGGILASTLTAVACLTWLFPTLPNTGAGGALSSPISGALLLGPLLAISGMVGDLAESLVKRDCGAKDSGDWLPGLGGVWDVTDSLIAAVLPAYLCFVAGVGAG